MQAILRMKRAINHKKTTAPKIIMENKKQHIRLMRSTSHILMVIYIVCMMETWARCSM